MPLTSRQRHLKRRQRRVKKLRELKRQLVETTDSKGRENLVLKIRKLEPWVVLSE
jgi:hypothetical protein